MAIDVPRKVLGYEVVEVLGEGAGSTIYAVTDPGTRQLYALKRVACHTPHDVRFVEQLRSEYEIASRVSHPGLRKAIALTVERTMLRRITGGILVLELFDGQSLSAAPAAALPELLAVFICAGHAVQHLHAAGYVHCDLKPGNILVSSDGRAKVIDLGLSCPIGTVKKRIQGTPDYITPEQVRCEPVTVRTDVFSFGATLYWALCRRTVPTLMTINRSDNSFLVDDFVASPSQIDPAIPESLSRMTMECIRTNPLKRPASIGEVVSRLELISHSLAWQGRASARRPPVPAMPLRSGAGTATVFRLPTGGATSVATPPAA